MPYVIPNDATHVLLSIIEFDEGEPEIGVLDFGNFASCDKTARMMSALSYSGERKVSGAFVSVREVADVFPDSRAGARPMSNVQSTEDYLEEYPVSPPKREHP